MDPRFDHRLVQSTDWWYESWGTSDWLRTLFNQPIEVHTFLLGGFIGILLAGLTARDYRKVSLLFTLLVVLFTFGTFETVFLCSDEFAACQHLRLKPWYFIAGFLTTHLFSQGVVAYGDRDRSETTEGRAEAPGSESRDIASLLAGLLLVALLGFALYSFVSPTPVHPITGLATIGGAVGSGLGLTAHGWARADTDSETTFLASLRRVLYDDIDGSVLPVAYGTVAGFGYPRLLWELGELVGPEDFLFGAIIWARNGLPSTVVYAAGLFVIGILFVRLRSLGSPSNRLNGNRFAAIVLGYVTYTFCLFVLTGYAGTVWFRVIPSA